MSPELHQRVRKLFDEALDLPESQRLVYLRSACVGDEEAFESVVRLLGSRAPAQAFLQDRPRRMERIGRYVIAEELGRGGMGVVYAAVDPLIARNLAIKVIHVEALADDNEAEFMRERLFREARSAGQLFHPGIVTVLDVGQEGGLAFIAMERVDGPSLQEIRKPDQRLPRNQVLDILRQTAAALDFAHQRQIVHRDVKPGNILLDRSGMVKLTDFGIAKINSTQKYTQTGMVMGTPSYMSPEQIEGRPVDGRSDQFSLAVVAFELLAGVAPFRSESLAGIAHAIVYGARPSARGANPELPRSVDAVLERALSIKAEDRFASCAEFVRELEFASSGVPLPPGPVVVDPRPADPLPPVPPFRPLPPPPVPPPAAREDVQTAGKKRGSTGALVAVGVLVVALAAGAVYRFVWNAPSGAAPAPVAAGNPGDTKPADTKPAETQKPAYAPVLPNKTPEQAPTSLVAHLTADPPSIKAGEFTTLHWDVAGDSKGGVRLTIQPDVGPVEAKDTAVRLNPRTTTLYILTATLPGGAATTAQARVTVDSSPAPATATPKPSQASIYDEAVKAKGSGPPEKAFQLFRQAADLGDARAMLELGNMSSDGVGTPKSYPAAVDWYRKSADAGNVTAMLMMGSVYYLGRGVPRDYSSAGSWYQKASDKGDPSAKYNLAQMYESGLGVDKRDLVKARQLYQESADLGNDEAKKKLAALAGKK